MPNTWNNRVEHVEDGQRVDAANTGRSTRQLEGQTRYLKDRLDALDAGEALIARSVTVHEDCVPGTPVFWRQSTQQYEPALARVEQDLTTLLLAPAASADVVGIVYRKINSTLADVCIAGRVIIDLTAVIAGTVADGRYYLSGTTAGKLVQQRPPVSVAVLHYADGIAVVAPAMRDFLEDHIHYQVELVCELADSSADPGWLAADDAAFDDLAPAGALYGYNVAAHSALSRLFPPIPTDACALFWDKGDGAGGGLVPKGPLGLVTINSDGIWWMADCDGTQPFVLSSASSSSSDSSGESASLCPVPSRMRLTFMFVHMVYATDRSVVTSLKAKEGSPLTFTNCNDEAASTGDLVADVDLDFIVDDDPVSGYQVIKELDGLSFKQGPVVEGVKAGTGILISGSEQNTDGYYQGLLTLNIDSDPAERELPPQTVRLIDAKEEYYKDIPYIGFTNGMASSIRLKFRVPLLGMPVTPKLLLRTWLMGRASGPFPTLTLTYRRMPRPSSPLLIPQPAAEAAITFATARTVVADHYFEVDSAEVSVDAGDTVLMTIGRSASDGFSGNIGVMQLLGVIVAG